MDNKEPEEIIETPEPAEVEELEDKALEEVAGGDLGEVADSDGKCHNTQCCG